MPEELFATTPPIVQAISLAGSDTRYTMKIDMRITTPDGKTDGGVITGKALYEHRFTIAEGHAALQAR